jgi:acetate kinase
MMLWLLEREAADEREMAAVLEHESGLAGLAGDADMRVVLARAESGDAGAALAIDVYVHRLRAGIAAMAASLNGIDVLVFTGGVGEHGPAVRARAAAGLGFLGLALDGAANETVTADAEITADASPVRTLVLQAREDLEMVRQTRHALGKSPSAVRGVPDERAPRRP